MAAGVEPGSAGTVIFFPEGAFGPTNNCIGIADVMRHRGWRVVFIAEESFAGTFVEKGFEERLMRLGPPPEVEGRVVPVPPEAGSSGSGVGVGSGLDTVLLIVTLRWVVLVAFRLSVAFAISV